VHDPTASVALARILLGPRYRVGFKDLALLARYASDETARLKERYGIDSDDAEADPVLIAESIEHYGSVAGLSDEARDRLAEFRDELAMLRGEALATAGVEVAVAHMLERDPARRWQADGSLLAAGHGGPNMERVRECLRKVCPDATSVVARLDPQTWKAQEIIRYPATERFYSSTVALQVGNEVWIGTITGDRIARYPIK